MACTPEACIYHVWQKVKLNPRDAELTEVCLACGVKLSDWKVMEVLNGSKNHVRESA